MTDFLQLLVFIGAAVNPAAVVAATKPPNGALKWPVLAGGALLGFFLLAVLALGAETARAQASMPTGGVFRRRAAVASALARPFMASLSPFSAAATRLALSFDAALICSV